MTPLVPQKMTEPKPGRLLADLHELLDSAVEFIEATAGWIGLQDAAGNLTFPVLVGSIGCGWLHWQQDFSCVWGFAVSDEPAILNNLNLGPNGAGPPLSNMLSTPLIHDQQILGHVTLANKAHGFSSDDAVVIQGLAHHMTRMLIRRRPAAPMSVECSSTWRRILDLSAEGILLLDESGVLIYANAVWLDWTGFSAEELLGHKAPFPFWVSQHELLQALSAAPTVAANTLPFRRRDQSLFWCSVEMVTEQQDEKLLTFAFLRRSAALPRTTFPAETIGDGVDGEQLPAMRLPALDSLPLLLDLDNGIEGWEGRWQEQTGLSECDVKGSCTELVLDWLFPQQQDRDRVADCFQYPRPAGRQLVLEVAAAVGSKPMLCTFLPFPSPNAAAVTRRWLLLVSEAEPSAKPKDMDGINRLGTERRSHAQVRPTATDQTEPIL